MSQPHPSPPPPALDPGGRPTLWCAPRGLTGLQLRTASSTRLPAGPRVALLAVVLVFGGGGGWAAAATGRPELLGLAVAVAAVAAAAVSRHALTRRRRSFGMVRLTPLQFDLVVALDQLPAHRIDVGRQLHDRLVSLLQQPSPDPLAVQQCEHWMVQVATGH